MPLTPSGRKRASARYGDRDRQERAFKCLGQALIVYDAASVGQRGQLLFGMAERRFPQPWIVEEHNACFIVKDATGQALGISISRRSSVGAQRMSALRQLRS
jgi:hypothetical protein